MDKQKGVRKTVGQESAFVDLLNQEMKELQDSMKQKQVDEMAVIISRDCGYCGKCKHHADREKGIDCTEFFAATALYNAGYRKIPEGAVVLTKAEYNSLRLLAKECIEWRWKYCNMNATESENKGGGENEQV